MTCPRVNGGSLRRARVGSARPSKWGRWDSAERARGPPEGGVRSPRPPGTGLRAGSSPRSGRAERPGFRRGERHATGPHTAELTTAFSTIYEQQTWTDAIPGMPRSGRGALYERSLSVVQFIEDRIAGGDVRTIVDVGCGDLTYMSNIAAVVNGDVSYVGYDIVPSLVDEHRRLPWGEFRVGDVTAPGVRAHADL